MNQDEIRLAVIGCGGFGLYALQQFTQVPGVKLVGMAGTNRPAAHAAAERFGVPDIQDVDKLLARDDVDMVYIATPPFLHLPGTGGPRGRQARHVRETAGDHARTGRRDDTTPRANEACLLTVNLMQRYNPIFDAVKHLIQSRTAGRSLARIL